MVIFWREKGRDFSLSDWISLKSGRKISGNHTRLLGTRSIYPKKPVNGDFNKIVGRFHSFQMLFIKKGIQGQYDLGGRFPKTWRADDQGPVVILQSTRKHLGGGCCKPVDKQDQWSIVHRAPVHVFHGMDLSFFIPGHTDGSGINKNPCQGNGFQHGSASIIPQIQDQAFDIFLFEFNDFFGHIIRTAIIPAFLTVPVSIKSRQGNEPDPVVTMQNKTPDFTVIVIQFGFFSLQGDFPRGAIRFF